MDKFEESEQWYFPQSFSQMFMYFLQVIVVFYIFVIPMSTLILNKQTKTHRNQKSKSAVYVDESTNCCTILFAITLLYHTT